MKNSKEIANAVLQARDKHIEQQEIRNRKIRKISAISGTACAVCLTAVGAGYFNSVQKNVPVTDTREVYIDNIVEQPVIEEKAETPVIEEKNEDITNIVPSETVSDTAEKSYIFISDSVVSDADIVEIPQAEVAVLSGPSHAEEVSRKIPTTIVAGANKKEVAEYKKVLENL